ncbi:unnamed protein product [Tenebrio molitor]|nr:unnamed protein product [Tenebrio molitor]
MEKKPKSIKLIGIWSKQITCPDLSLRHLSISEQEQLKMDPQFDHPKEYITPSPIFCHTQDESSRLTRKNVRPDKINGKF